MLGPVDRMVAVPRVDLVVEPCMAVGVVQKGFVVVVVGVVAASLVVVAVLVVVAAVAAAVVAEASVVVVGVLGERLAVTNWPFLASRPYWSNHAKNRLFRSSGQRSNRCTCPGGEGGFESSRRRTWRPPPNSNSTHRTHHKHSANRSTILFGAPQRRHSFAGIETLENNAASLPKVTPVDPGYH